MGLKKATVKVFTCYRRQRKDGKYPIKLKVTFKGDSYEYKLNLFVTEDEDKLLTSGKFGRNDSIKKIYNQMIAYQSRANTIIEGLPRFSKIAFEKGFAGNSYENGSGSTDLVHLLIQKSDKLRLEESISYADSFKTTANSIEGYKRKVLVEDVNVDFLLGFEQYLLNKGNSSGSVGVYMRNIRTTFNEAVQKGIITQDHYPFGRRKYCIPQQRNNKTALHNEDVSKILNYKAVIGSSEEKARDMWIFMYLTNGLNMKDVALLKIGNLKPEMRGLSFFRAKTKKTTKHNKIEIDVWYDENNVDIIKAITQKHGTKSNSTEDYLFPILNTGVKAADERRLIQNFTRYVNKNMAKISLKLGLSSVPKTNVARHTFVTTIVNVGNAPLTAVKDLMGHSSITTTAGYVNTLPINMRKEYSSCLIVKEKK